MSYIDKWVNNCKDSLKECKVSKFKENVKNIIQDFDNLEILGISKPKV